MLLLCFLLCFGAVYGNDFVFAAKDKGLNISGATAFNAHGALKMDGKTNVIYAKNLPQINMKKGFTVEFTAQRMAIPGDTAAGLAYDAVCQKEGSFVLARYNRSFYMLIHDGKKFQKAFQTGYLFPQKTDDRPRHIVMTSRYHEAIDQGEIWTEVQIFVDGKSVYSTKLPGKRIPDGKNNWEFGAASRFGRVWNFGGEVYGGGVFDRVLSEKEIRDRVAEYGNIIKPDFPIAAKISKYQQAKINKFSVEQRFACINLIRSRFEDIDKVLANPAGFLRSYGGNIKLTLLDMPDKVRIASFCDIKNKHEFFNWNNPFFILNFVRGNQKVALSMNDLHNTLQEAPITENGITRFTILHKRSEFPALSGKSHWQFDGKRLEYSLEINSETYATLLKEVSYPALNLGIADKSVKQMIIPEAGGLLYKDAVTAKIDYRSEYPRMKTSMQCGAFFDELGGIYFSPADPLGRAKFYQLRTDTDGAEIRINWNIAFDAPNRKNSFISKSSAVVEFFKGDWYDVGLLYRNELDRINCVWWRKNLPNTDTPEWFRNNTLGLLMFHMPAPQQAIQLRKYLGLPFTIQHWYWWERGAGHHLAPLPRANNEYLAYAKLMKENGVRIFSYTNGRLWSSKDKRGEGTLFNTLGKKAAVKKADGSVQMEPYGAPCAVLCPDNDIYRQSMFNMVTRLVAQGVSGCFMDQLGAARPIICQSAEHGHRINDPESWNINGHRKAFLPIRKYWRDNNIDAVMTTEDNSEHCVGIIDGLFPWRWMHDNQIPLHAMVYSGRTQYVSRDPTGEDMNAPYPKAATQIVQGEQIGHFGIAQLTSPAKGNFRRYIKRLMHLRMAAISYFNCGMMLRPVKYLRPMQILRTRWGNHGTKDVRTPAVINGSWQLGNNRIVILINTTGKIQKNAIADDFSDLKYIFKSGKNTHKGSEFELEPYGCELRIYGDELKNEELAKIEKYFNIIRKTAAEPDPFGVDKINFPEQPPFNPAQWQQAAASPVVLGARANKDAMVLDNVYYGLFYAGIADFGEGGKGFFELELSAPSYSGGGNVEIWLDHPDNGRMVGRLICDREKILTKSWNDYRPYRLEANTELKGKHKIFFKLNGGSVCNFRNWRWVAGGKK